MKLRFWGVRGSTPTPGPGYVRYGGNTPCIEVRVGDNLLVLDCGTGLRELGKAYLREFSDQPLQVFVFLTHYHWDHIQGLPFFEPLYDPRNHFYFHGFSTGGARMQEALQWQMTNPYFPVNMDQMKARSQFRELAEESVDLHSVRVTSKRLSHPQGCYGYRLESGSEVIVLATDNEPGDPVGDRNVRELAAGADLLIYDAQYTLPEYESKRKGWGHSTWNHGVQIAEECGVRELILFHHDPDHKDAFLDKIAQDAREVFPAARVSAEGMEIDVSSTRKERIRHGNASP